MSPRQNLHTYKQASPFVSPRPLADRLLLPAWEAAWCIFCSWTPKSFNAWRLAWLRLFGARLNGVPFVHQRARIEVPWKLIMHDRSCLGDRSHAYCLDVIEIGERATVAQEAYLCTGTHDMDDETLPLATAPISIGADAFVGARAFLMPGVSIGAGAVIGACALVTQDMPEWTVCFGSPCRPVRPRKRGETDR